MKASVSSMTVSHASEKAWFGTAMELIKARLTALVLMTTAVGFYVGHPSPIDFILLGHALLGTGLVAAGASALNQLLERDYDAQMPRTENRPLPSGKMQPETVLLFGAGVSALGLLHLAFFVNLLTSFLGAVTLISYVAIYTPLKRVTTLNTVIGAVPGAIPPLMGWTAAQGEISAPGWSLFAILFFWQLPHFLAIAWLYRDEYARAGYKMLPVFDADGQRTARSSVSHTLGLLPVSLCPFLFQLAGVVYLVGALIFGVVFLWCAVRFSRDLSKASARRLFLTSIVYLPVLLALMVFDKVK